MYCIIHDAPTFCPLLLDEWYCHGVVRLSLPKGVGDTSKTIKYFVTKSTKKTLCMCNTDGGAKLPFERGITLRTSLPPDGK